ncbi:hypothetical protein CVT24_009502 [Panaeolus cyanescens]|uniref:Elongator complex protein 2 n=1 Tax=Panaeolus cyanescens TaxID=181874 RepID=A0A409VAH2_9AGAR|nr:hypothetical protein CVT24_009502 [Panaeolus cyanescens]
MSSLAYVAASANRYSHIADVSSDSLVAYGSSRFVALWDTADIDRDTGVHQTLAGHIGNVTSVKFLKNDVLLSTDDQGNLRSWRRQSADQWSRSAEVHAHKSTITALCVQENSVITGSSDSSVKVWNFARSNDEGQRFLHPPNCTSEQPLIADVFEEVQTIDLKGRYPLALSIGYLPGTQVSILAVGGTDSKVQLWIRSEDKFIRSATLDGHEDWIRGLAFNSSNPSNPSLVLASGSQDSTIRLWNIEAVVKAPQVEGQNASDEVNDDLLDKFEASLGELGDNEEGGRQISMKRHVLTAKTGPEDSQQFTVTFDALLIGHEAGVTSLSWRQDSFKLATLLSTSTDSSVILWSPSEIVISAKDTTSLWINRQRFGDVGGQRLGGFVGGLWSRNGNEVLGWGWAGGCRRWRCTTAANGTDESWHEVGAVTGHRGPVKGLNWSPDGAYLISTGLDQTTRIHGPVHNEKSVEWHEIARPQVHGYDLINASFIDPLKFASIADEKVVRVFEAPRGFLETAEKLKVSTFDDKFTERPAAANVPPLGLSNKASSEGAQSMLAEVDSSRRPFEGELAAITLWPEVEKIFGHGYEASRIFPLPPNASLIRVMSLLQQTRPMDESSGIAVGRLREMHSLPHPGIKLQVKIWHKEGDKWTAALTIKTEHPATSLVFSPAYGNKKRRLAIGLENGHVLIYNNDYSSLADWKLEEEITSTIAHVDHIHRMEWRPTTDSSKVQQLATCSEDGTLRILTIPTNVD